MSKQRFASVWDAIEDTPAEAESMKARAKLMNDLIAFIKKQELTQAEAAKRLGVTQPRVSDLMRGKIDLFSLDMLVNMLALVGRRVEMKVKREPALA
jgi:predicted XRE-type DNA-binding protein